MKIFLKESTWSELTIPEGYAGLVLAKYQCGEIQSTSDLFRMVLEHQIDTKSFTAPEELTPRKNSGRATVIIEDDEGNVLWDNAPVPHNQPEGAIQMWRVARDRRGGGQWEYQWFATIDEAIAAYAVAHDEEMVALREAGETNQEAALRAVDDALCLSVHHIPIMPHDLALALNHITND